MRDTLDRYSTHALALLRIVTALIFMLHGLQKLFGFPEPPEGGLPGPLVVLDRGHPGTRRRPPHPDRPVHPARRFPARGRDGGGLLAVSRSPEHLSGSERRRCGHSVLFRVSALCVHGTRCLEHRRGASPALAPPSLGALTPEHSFAETGKNWEAPQERPGHGLSAQQWPARSRRKARPPVSEKLTPWGDRL